MGARKRQAGATEAPRRLQSGEVRIRDRVGIGEALAAALEPFGVGVAVVDPSTLRFTFVGKALAALLGASPDVLLALPSATLRFDDAIAAERALRVACPAPVRLNMVHSSGALVEVELSVRAFHDGHEAEEGGASDERDRPRAVVCAVREIQSAAPDAGDGPALEAATALLRARDELFSMAAHEIRAPLTSMRLHLQALGRGLYREPIDATRARRAAEMIDRQAGRVSMMADQLLDVARIHRGRLELERVPVDLGVIVREVAARFGVEIASRGATIIIDGEKSVPGRWDAQRLDQVVTNLVSNALKYGDGKPIVVELRSSSSRARLSVRDHGAGIEEDDHARIFEPFERATTDAKAHGTGLGLWIVREIVRAHGGEVSIASVVGKGTVFLVDLPRSVDH